MVYFKAMSFYWQGKLSCDECGTSFELYAYGDGTCPTCGREYVYEEGHMAVLSDEDWEAVRERKAKR